MEKDKKQESYKFKLYLPDDVAGQIDELSDELYEKNARGLFLSFGKDEEEAEEELSSLATLAKENEGYRLSDIGTEQLKAPVKMVFVKPQQRSVLNNSAIMELNENPLLQYDINFRARLFDRQHLVDLADNEFIPVDKLICRFEYTKGKTIPVVISNIRGVNYGKENNKEKIVCRYKIKKDGELITFNGIVNEKTLVPVFGLVEIRVMGQRYGKLFNIGGEKDPKTIFLDDKGRVFPGLQRDKVNVLDAYEKEGKRFSELLKMSAIDNPNHKALSKEETEFVKSFLERYPSASMDDKQYVEYEEGEGELDDEVDLFTQEYQRFVRIKNNPNKEQLSLADQQFVQSFSERYPF